MALARLKRVQRGVWESADGRFRFRHMDYCGYWYVYEASPHPDDDGFYDEPSFGVRFYTLSEAVDYVKRRRK